MLRDLCIAIVAGALLISCGGGALPETAMRIQDAKPRQTELMPRVHFPTASDEILEEDRDVIANNARWMGENPSAVLILEGHCDERGGDDYNMHLGDRRARAAKENLIEGGVDEDSLIVVSHGERRPIDPSHDHEAWSKNRRVDFVIR